jgi:hypothetical protein
MPSIESLCKVRDSIFDRNRRDVVLDISDVVENMECTPNTGQVVKQHYINLTFLHIQSVVDILSSNAVSFHYRHSR